MRQAEERLAHLPEVVVVVVEEAEAEAAGGRRLAARHQRQKRQEAGSGAGNDGSGGGARWGKCESYPYILHTPWFLKIIYRKHTHPGSGVRFCAR